MSVGIVFWYQYARWNQKSIQPIIAIPTPAQPINATTTDATTTKADNHLGMKLYRNDKFGFELWYPEAWEVLENIYKGGASKFTLVAHPAGTYPNFEPFIVNITTTEFVEHSFVSYKDIAIPFVVDGILGEKYKYEAETYYTDIIVPIGDTRIIISNSNNEYVPEFNNMLSTFKFLK